MSKSQTFRLNSRQTFAECDLYIQQMLSLLYYVLPIVIWTIYYEGMHLDDTHKLLCMCVELLLMQARFLCEAALIFVNAVTHLKP